MVRREHEARRRSRGRDDAGATADAHQFLQRVQSSSRAVSGLPQQPQHSPSRRAGDLSPAYGVEGAVNLRRKLRRTLPASRGSRRNRRLENSFLAQKVEVGVTGGARVNNRGKILGKLVG